MMERDTTTAGDPQQLRDGARVIASGRSLSERLAAATAWRPHAPALCRWVERTFSWHACVRDRRILESLDDRMLRDIGIDRGTADNESTVSFWRWR